MRGNEDNLMRMCQRRADGVKKCRIYERCLKYRISHIDLGAIYAVLANNLPPKFGLCETNKFLMSVSWVGEWESWQHETVESGTGDCLASEFYIGFVGVYCGSILGLWEYEMEM